MAIDKNIRTNNIQRFAREDFSERCIRGKTTADPTDDNKREQATKKQPQVPFG
jgi:hypothetical protein